jgi:hypothetical protein
VHLAPAAPLIAEVLYSVGEKYLSRIEAGFAQELTQEKPGWTDERMPAAIFVASGRLADQHQPCAARTFSNHGLRRFSPENAAATSRWIPGFAGRLKRCAQVMKLHDPSWLDAAKRCKPCARKSNIDCAHAHKRLRPRLGVQSASQDAFFQPAL